MSKRKQQKLHSQAIDTALRRRITPCKKQILILGACSSGKSTFRHGIYHLSKETNSMMNAEERELHIRKYVIRCLDICWQTFKIVDFKFSNLNEEIKKARKSGVFTSSMIEFMKYLTMLKSEELEFISHHFRYMENIRYFFSENFIAKLQAINADFTIHDLLQTKIPHSKSSIYEFSFETSKLIDPSPQRNEKRKWISHFDNTMTRVIYLISLADYNLTDSISGANCLWLALQNFSEFVNYSEYIPADVSIVFTKLDLFKEKLEKYPFSDYFTEYTGPNDSETILTFLLSQNTDLTQFNIGNMLSMNNIDNINYLAQENENVPRFVL
ncbi:predicted protein [Naegleria gruberi]|uniref:Predicted protein n=1 Tax=Naegleria gruberi TaxID=5762 RepID=D2VVC0_NAEGR|nr:uncharacterized protein NAEGRDRAFT_72962 [Naegleria gruberi]EFC39283.1 predicted protein [Naegleria gruberi]|eukprot:XP_002672027.1 predicted protein [Naegleria gruberi strain NEG-M]